MAAKIDIRAESGLLSLHAGENFELSDEKCERCIVRSGLPKVSIFVGLRIVEHKTKKKNVKWEIGYRKLKGRRSFFCLLALDTS